MRNVISELQRKLQICYLLLFHSISSSGHYTTHIILYLTIQFNFLLTLQKKLTMIFSSLYEYFPRFLGFNLCSEQILSQNVKVLGTIGTLKFDARNSFDTQGV
jgi:hypothetical protein